MTSRRPRRAGFTLLEILLASLIAALLLGALYFALNVTLQQAQVTRDAVESEDLARGVFAKLTGDLNGTLAPLPPKSGGNAAASGGQVTGGTAGTDPNAAAGGAAGAAGATGTGGAAGTAGAGGDATATDPNAATAEPGATDNATAVAADLSFQGGLIGEETKFTIFAGRTPEVFTRFGNPGEQVLADVRQVIYWFEPGRGLYRRVRPWVTADGVRNGIESDPDAPDSVLLAEEVTGVAMEYSDGSTWAATWDGTQPGPDGVTPLGPPRAVRVTLTFQVAVSKGEPVTRTVSQVIVVRAAPGTYTPPLVEAPTDGATEGGSGTGTGSGTSGGATGGSAGGMAGGATGGSAGGATGGGARPTTGGSATGGTGGGARPTTGGSTGGTSGGSRPSTGTGGTGGGSRPSTGGGTGGSTGGSRPSTGGTTGGGMR